MIDSTVITIALIILFVVLIDIIKTKNKELKEYDQYVDIRWRRSGAYITRAEGEVQHFLRDYGMTDSHFVQFIVEPAVEKAISEYRDSHPLDENLDDN